MIMNYYWKPLVVLIAYFAAEVVGQLEDLVLGGNYGSSLNNIPNLRALRGDSNTNTDNNRNQDFHNTDNRNQDLHNTNNRNQDFHNTNNRNQDFKDNKFSPGGEKGISGKSKLTEVLEAYAKNYEALMIRTANLTNIFAVTPDNRHCEITCRGLISSYCYLQCLTFNTTREYGMPEPKMEEFRKIIAGTVYLFCKSLNTSAERLFTDNAERSKFNSVKSFRAALGLTDQQSVTRVRGIMVSAVYGAILQYTDTPLSPVKHVIPNLHEVLAKQFPGSSYDLEPNTICTRRHMVMKMPKVYDAYFKALKVELSTRNSYFPGFAVANSVSKYISTKSSFRLTLVLELFRMLTGRSTGFECLTTPELPPEEPQDGFFGTQLCDDLGKAPILGFPIPPNIPEANPGGSYMSLSNPLCLSEPSEFTEATDLPPTPATSKKNKKNKKQ